MWQKIMGLNIQPDKVKTEKRTLYIVYGILGNGEIIESEKCSKDEIDSISDSVFSRNKDIQFLNIVMLNGRVKAVSRQDYYSNKS